MLRFRSKWWITLLVILAISFCPLLLVVKAKTWTSHFLHLHKLIPAANLTNHSKSPLSAAFSLPLAYCSANNPLSSTWHCGHSTRQGTATCSHTDVAEPDGYRVKLPFWIIYQHPPLQLDMDVLPQDICCPKKLPVGCRPNSRHTVHKNSYPCSLLTQPASRTAACSIVQSKAQCSGHTVLADCPQCWSCRLDSNPSLHHITPPPPFFSLNHLNARSFAELTNNKAFHNLRL